MDVFVSKHQSRIMDFLWVPNLLTADYKKVDLTAKERDLTKSQFEDLALIQRMLMPFKPRIDQFFRGRIADNFMVHLYFHLLEAGHDPKDLKELYPLFLSLPEEILRTTYLRAMVPRDIKIEHDADFFNYLSESNLEAELKWQSLWSYHHLKETVQGSIALYKELEPLYAPFYAKYEPAVDEMIKNLDLISLYKGSIFDIEDYFAKSKKTQARVFVTSDIHFSQMITEDEDNLNAPIYFCVYPLASFYIHSRQNMTADTLDILLKAISDPIRYQILQLVTTTNLKNKDIASQINTTAANVSFHIQKLLNANLLLLELNDKSTRYRLNQAYFEEAMTKIQDDFGLKNTKK